MDDRLVEDLDSEVEALTAERDQLRARVEVLTEALKNVTSYFTSAPVLMSTEQLRVLDAARAALAAGSGGES